MTQEADRHTVPSEPVEKTESEERAAGRHVDPDRPVSQGAGILIGRHHIARP
jgi:hypothetical protein